MRTVLVDPAGYGFPYDHALCDALARLGCDAVLATPAGAGSEWPLERAYAEWGGFRESSVRHPRIARLPVIGGAFRALDHALGLRRFLRHAKGLRPDVIHFVWLPLPVVDSPFLARLRRICPLVLTLHNTTLFHGSPSSRIQGFGLPRVVRRFDRVVVHTEYSRRRLLDLGWAAPGSVRVIPHGALDGYTFPFFEEYLGEILERLQLPSAVLR